MTIDEAIEHAEEIACGNDRCAKDHAQLADWLCELRRARMEIDLLKTLRDGFKVDAQRCKAENAKLRELLEAILQCAGETKRDKGCDACPMFNGDEAGAYLNKNWCLLRPTMRELGIEVPHD